MKKLAIFAAALMLTLGLAQCKKEQPAAQTTEGETVHITVNVGNNGSKADIVNGNQIQFKDGDILYVGYNGAKVGGELTYSTDDNCFSGELTIAQVGDDKPLHFYYLGGSLTPTVSGSQYTVDISNQTSNYPVISYGTTSPINYTGPGAYTTTLLNKCGLVKFSTPGNIGGAVKISGLYTKATIDFANPNPEVVVTPSTEGTITLHSGASNTEKWAILLPQTSISATATVSGYPCSISSIPNIENNAYLNSGVAINLVQTVTWDSYFLGDHHHIDTYGGATSFTENGITVTVSGGAQFDGDNQIYLSSSSDKLNFASSGGRKMTKIEITYGSCNGTPSSSWTKSGSKLTWTGSSTSVDLTCTSSGGGGLGGHGGIGGGIGTSSLTLSSITQIQFTFEN